MSPSEPTTGKSDAQMCCKTVVFKVFRFLVVHLLTLHASKICILGSPLDLPWALHSLVHPVIPWGLGPSLKPSRAHLGPSEPLWALSGISLGPLWILSGLSLDSLWTLSELSGLSGLCLSPLSISEFSLGYLWTLSELFGLWTLGTSDNLELMNSI